MRTKIISRAPRADTDYARRAIYVMPNGSSFDDKLPQIPAHVFEAERDRAFDAATGTDLIALDLSSRLETGFPATTPNLLARYARLGAGDELTLELRATGEVYYAIQGAGVAAKDGDRIRWRAGDAFCLPGGGTTVLSSEDADSVLWLITDEPALAYVKAEPPAAGQAPVQAVHYPASTIRRHLDEVLAHQGAGRVTGRVVLLTSAEVERTWTTTPTIALAMNALEPGGDQLPHRHNGVALTLCVQGDGVYSMIDGERVDWQAGAVMVTPPTALHSHHNRGAELMLSIVAQDGGLFYHARAVGFSWD